MTVAYSKKVEQHVSFCESSLFAKTMPAIALATPAGFEIFRTALSLHNNLECLEYKTIRRYASLKSNLYFD